MSMSSKLKNSFNLNEWSGAFGDLGTLLPLAFALIVFNGFSPIRLFFLWGIIYVITGLIFKVPISVQPLKAMSVIAIASGISQELLSSTAIFFGLILILLTYFGIIDKLKKLFSNPIVRGIQLGVGLILAKKAIQLIINNGILLHFGENLVMLNLLLTLVLIILLFLFQVKFKIQMGLILVIASIIIVSVVVGIRPLTDVHYSLFKVTMPNFSFFLNALVLLIIPQIPLTLGNAIFAANDTANELWKKQASNVSIKRLSYSIGISDIFIGFFGGFPICHGSGGMAAHSQFGGKTGGSTIILGLVLIICSLINPLSSFLFLIPIPLLASMLIFDSVRMCLFVLKLENYKAITVASTVGVLSFLTKNLTIGLVAGLVIEFIFKFASENKITTPINGGVND